MELKSERVLTVHGCICFYRLLPEQRGDILPAGLRLSRALARLHVGMATASAGPGSSSFFGVSNTLSNKGTLSRRPHIKATPTVLCDIMLNHISELF